MGKKRILRVNELLRKELAQILLEELELPSGTFLTIAEVDSSLDLQHAKIWVTIIPEGRSKEILSIVSGSIYTIQQRLNKRLVMRPIPKIEFVPLTA